ncbi:PASTA domain-containing protein [Microbacterium sp. NIBRBAC000506063]|uniref:PASTA domain-containing protein n=1 Tax=Microbacterium sp. NIBRBAC000506063 TaxID=2734618 RepID=UPI002948BD1A|nr:PASTA domain-containing protein [Microbacterium sp. NIBRBAC000506063]
MTRTQSGPPIVWIWAGVALLAILIASVLFWAITMQPRGEVSAGSRIVPDLSGMTFDRAKQELEALDLVAKQSPESSAEVAEGLVIRSDPGPTSPSRRRRRSSCTCRRVPR